MSQTNEDVLPKPLGFYVLIQQEEEKLGSGVLVRPDISKKHEYLVSGVIKAIGPGMADQDGNEVVIRNLNVGDRVFFAKTGTNSWKHPVSGKEYLFLSFQSLIAVLPPKKD